MAEGSGGAGSLSLTRRRWLWRSPKHQSRLRMLGLEGVLLEGKNELICTATKLGGDTSFSGLHNLLDG